MEGLVEKKDTFVVEKSGDEMDELMVDTLVAGTVGSLAVYLAV